MIQKDTAKLIRLYTPENLKSGAGIVLSEPQHHYLRNVMRLGENDALRLFNDNDGEWLCALKVLDKKQAVIEAIEQLRAPETARDIKLYFAPIKKQRLSNLIEKAVELGVSELIPVITSHTENRKLNIEKIQLQIIEAAEQCERLSVPKLHDALSFDQFLAALQTTQTTTYAALERHDAAPIHEFEIHAPCAFFIGPEGGFSETEKVQIERVKQEQKLLKTVNLGKLVLRSETAALFCLSQVQF